MIDKKAFEEVKSIIKSQGEKVTLENVLAAVFNRITNLENIVYAHAVADDEMIKAMADFAEGIENDHY